MEKQKKGRFHVRKSYLQYLSKHSSVPFERQNAVTYPIRAVQLHTEFHSEGEIGNELDALLDKRPSNHNDKIPE